VERTSLAAGASAGAAPMMRSPMRGWRRTNVHSSASRGAGLVQHFLWDCQLADIMELGCLPQVSLVLV
jgi:hypothetical protein